ncbi:hypothetical protein EX30DRAFT_363575 [Ascodesmis nigricans]|uniref:Zinc-binding domain-containing protein n=1 Tax=Ascodesmis nigricans TaxID=341454 RepID=A0A4S2MZC2_9PEZI|nr:hypothetical protein EX30DRAFT_363575 [Ascodesmis nigricans]
MASSSGATANLATPESTASTPSSRPCIRIPAPSLSHLHRQCCQCNYTLTSWATHRLRARQLRRELSPPDHCRRCNHRYCILIRRRPQQKLSVPEKQCIVDSPLIFEPVWSCWACERVNLVYQRFSEGIEANESCETCGRQRDAGCVVRWYCSMWNLYKDRMTEEVVVQIRGLVRGFC